MRLKAPEKVMELLYWASVDQPSAARMNELGRNRSCCPQLEHLKEGRPRAFGLDNGRYLLFAPHECVLCEDGEQQSSGVDAHVRMKEAVTIFGGRLCTYVMPTAKRHRGFPSSGLQAN